MKTGRNEPCSCGSGKKSKNCCRSAARSASRSGTIGMIVAGIAVAGTIAVIAATRNDPAETTTTAPVEQASTPAPTPGQTPAPAPAALPLSATAPRPGAQPPGPAPAGKIWSAEHGHWHDKPASLNEWVSVTPKQSVPLNTSGEGLPVNIPAPKGPAPEGLVWWPEHGHWHDAKTGKAVQPEVPKDVATQMKEPGLPTELQNYVWSEEHKHWHRKDAKGEHQTATVVQEPNGVTPPPTKPQ